jgi:hypothetical protein
MPTLTTTKLLAGVLSSYKVKFPMLFNMGITFNDAPIRLGETVKAHIRTLPSKATWDASTGYANGATEGRTLLEDIDVTVDGHEFVPIEFSHLNNISDQKDSWNGAVADATYVLGKAMVDSVLAKARASNISRELVEATANFDAETLENVCATMNEAGAAMTGRIGLVNSSVATRLSLDTRISSKDFYGQLNGASPLRVFRNVAGFDAIYEYPGMATNNRGTQAVTATAATDILTAAGHGFRNGDKVRFTTSDTLPAGLAVNTTYYVRDAATDTFKVAATDGGTAIDITNTGTGTHAVVGWENLSALFFEPSAIAMRVGTPTKTGEMASALGIPQTMAFESMTDPDSGFPMTLVKWQQTGTGDLFVAPASIWGSAIGRQAGAASALTDKGAFRVVTA